MLGLPQLKSNPMPRGLAASLPTIKKQKSPSLTSAFCFQADTIPLRFDASHQHLSVSYVKRAISKGLESLETGRGCAQAIPAT